MYKALNQQQLVPGVNHVRERRPPVPRVHRLYELRVRTVQSRGLLSELLQLHRHLLQELTALHGAL